MNELSGEWLEVAEVDGMEVEDILRFDHEQKIYCIYRLEDGFYATDGLCTHEEVLLEDGLVMDDEIECPMHQGVFNIKTGKVIMDPPCEDLKTYKLKVEDEQIFIEL